MAIDFITERQFWNILYTLAVPFLSFFRALKVLITLKLNTKKYIQNGTTIAQIFSKTAKKYPQKNCILFEKQRWTFDEVESYTNKVANYFNESGYRKGDVVAIFMENRPEYIALWLGLSKIGVVAALINYNLRNQPLAHSISAADAKGIIFAGELSPGG